MKYVYQEKDEIATRLNELKNELNIKEIYIRQLAKHSSVDSVQGQQTIQTLTGCGCLTTTFELHLLV